MVEALEIAVADKERYIKAMKDKINTLEYELSTLTNSLKAAKKGGAS